MNNDDKPFQDLVTNILHYTTSLTTTIEHKFDSAALAVRESLSTATWLPPSARPSPPPQPLPVVGFPRGRAQVSGNLFWRSYARSVQWVGDHAAITAGVVAFVGTGGFLLWQRRRSYVRKRRARRDANGMRTEVVVIACTPNAPIPRSIILDLERRGFIVYVVVSSSVEENMVKAENKMDILPLHLNVTDPSDVQNTLQNFAALFTDPQTSPPHSHTTPNQTSSQPHLPQHQQHHQTRHFHLAGLVLIPDLHYPSSPLEPTPLDLWSDTLNTRILLTAATIQAFTPLLSATTSRILLLNSTATSSLHLAFHTLESTITAALSGFTASLRAELATLEKPVAVTEIRLGSFDMAYYGAGRAAMERTATAAGAGARQGGSGGNVHAQQALQRRERNVILEWPLEVRERYAKNFMADSERWSKTGLGLGFGFGFLPFGLLLGTGYGRASPLRELHNQVFDALAVGSAISQAHAHAAGLGWMNMAGLGTRLGLSSSDFDFRSRMGLRSLFGFGAGNRGPRAVYRVGRGSWSYEVVGRWKEYGVVEWMMGMRLR